MNTDRLDRHRDKVHDGVDRTFRWLAKAPGLRDTARHFIDVYHPYIRRRMY